jgi:GNAT superfamily N-acetyltransferase
MPKETLLPQTDEERAAGHFRTSGGYHIHVEADLGKARDFRKANRHSWKTERTYIGRAHIYPPGTPPEKRNASKRVGGVYIQVDNRGNMNGEHLSVEPEHRGKGLAPAVYDAIETQTKAKLVPGEKQLADGAAMWHKRAGVEFKKVGAETYAPKKRLKSFAEFMREDYGPMIGSGRSKEVFEHPSNPNKVMVRMRRHETTEAFLDFAAHAHDLGSPMAKYLPNPRIISKDNTHVTYETDKLQKQAGRVRVGKDHNGWFVTGMDASHPQHDDILKTVMTLHAHLKQKFPNGTHYFDLHPDNIMQDARGNHILNDPVEGGR